MNRAAAGRSIELYYIDGLPDGMLTAKMFNWSGQVLVTPRTQLPDALTRKETSHAGVYILLGEQEGAPLAYIGESETLASRIKSHDVQKDFWTQAILVSTAGNELNKAHVHYLEARLIQTAMKVGHTPLTNGTAPPLPSLSEAEAGKMEAFLANLLLMLPAVRVDLFVERARPTVSASVQGVTAAGTSPRFVMTIKRHGLRATAVLENGEFIVEVGSQARGAWEGVGAETTGRLYQELRRSGTLRLEGDHCLFTQNYAFKSPSAAAAVVSGRASNGTTEWRTESGRTYKDWESELLSAG